MPECSIGVVNYLQRQVVDDGLPDLRRPGVIGRLGVEHPGVPKEHIAGVPVKLEVRHLRLHLRLNLLVYRLQLLDEPT